MLLVYPFFRPSRDDSEFRFPPLGLAYLASSLEADGHEVRILDCTFMAKKDAMREARASGAEVVGIYSMITMRPMSLEFASSLARPGRLLVAGGPLPSADPESFLPPFDLVVRGEGEDAMREIVAAFESGNPVAGIPGTVRPSPAGRADGSPIAYGPDRPCREDIDSIPFPARHLLPNASYLAHGRRRYGRAVASVMSTRGCPFECEFCSNAVFGRGYRERSPANVVDEVEDALSLGYERIHFGDDVFTLRKERVMAICDEIRGRGLRFSWECLGRVDSIDAELAAAMRASGCDRVFFGIESGDERVLALMRKRITPDRARAAVVAAHEAGMRTGAFFILFYPGDDDDSVLRSIGFAVSLPLDYLSFTLPYPIPGTALHERVKDRAIRAWNQRRGLAVDRGLIFDADFSQAKMKAGLAKARIERLLRGKATAPPPPVFRLFERTSDRVLRRLR